MRTGSGWWPAVARPRDARRSEFYPVDADYGARRTFEFRTKRRCFGSPPPPSPRPLLRPNRPVTRLLAPRKQTACGSDGIKSELVTILALARFLGVSHMLGTMREILPGIFTWGSTYADRPWDLNGYAIRLDGCTVLVDPPAPGEDDWPSFDVMKPIAKIVLTNRDHVRDAELFRTRCGARLVAGADEVTQARHQNSLPKIRWAGAGTPTIYSVH